MLAPVVALHLVGWGILFLLVLPQHLVVGSQVFGLGLGVTAYTLGARHAFDADHIAAIDNTTRKLMAEGKRPVSVGFWFAAGHSTMVFVLAGLVGAGATVVTTMTDSSSEAHAAFAAVSTVASGGFLYLIGLVNLVALLKIVGVARWLREGGYDEAQLEQALDARGVLGRLLSRVGRSVSRPAQMFPVGLLLGLGFDTASEVTLLVLTGTGASGGVPWYALLALPLLFAAGMTLFDSLDGTFMNFAYAWAFSSPVRKIYYNLSITALSVAVALGIGSIELVTILHDRLRLRDGLSTRIAALDLGDLGYLVAAVFVLIWAAAVAVWKLGRVEQRWTSRLEGTSG